MASRHILVTNLVTSPGNWLIFWVLFQDIKIKHHAFWCLLQKNIVFHYINMAYFVVVCHLKAKWNWFKHDKMWEKKGMNTLKGLCTLTKWMSHWLNVWQCILVDAQCHWCENPLGLLNVAGTGGSCAIRDEAPTQNFQLQKQQRWCKHGGLYFCALVMAGILLWDYLYFLPFRP